MAYDTDFIVRLIGASELIERRGNLEDALGGLAEMAAKLLSASTCSIMLLGDEEVADGMPHEPGLRVYAHYGALPQEAYAQFTRLNEGISGHVAATAEPLLIENIARSPFMSVARHAHDRPGSLVSTPIFLNDKVIGVFNVSSPLDERVFIRRDLDLLSIFALFVGKSIHVAQLQNVLRSRLMQVALALEEKGGRAVSPLSPDPVHLAKILAKTIYREMTESGFGTSQIVGVATEVIGLLNEKLEHSGDHAILKNH